jgi:hypothetical protein
MIKHTAQQFQQVKKTYMDITAVPSIVVKPRMKQDIVSEGEEEELKDKKRGRDLYAFVIKKL